MNPIRVLLADDHTLIRAGLRMVVASQPDFTVVHERHEGRGCDRLGLRGNPEEGVRPHGRPGLDVHEADGLLAEDLVFRRHERDRAREHMTVDEGLDRGGRGLGRGRGILGEQGGQGQQQERRGFHRDPLYMDRESDLA